MRKLPFIEKFLENSEYCTKIKIYFSSKIAGSDFDPYAQNYTYVNLNPITIKGYVTEISPSSLVWKGYGLKNIGSKEIICKSKYKDWLKNANKVEIDGEKYEVFREATGNRVIIQNRPYGSIRVILEKRD